MKKKENKYFFKVSPISKLKKLANKKVEVVGVSFKNEKDALKWLKNNGKLLSKTTYAQFKDDLKSISGFNVNLYSGTKVIKTIKLKK